MTLQMEEMHRASRSFQAILYHPAVTSMVSDVGALQTPHFGGFMEASLHRHDG